jgi:hypothetical protein
MTNQSNKSNKNILKQQQELGARLQEFYDMGYVSKKRALGFSFLKGLVSGVGVFVGGSLVITLFVWLLSLFDQIPLLSGLVDAIRKSLQSN